MCSQLSLVVIHNISLMVTSRYKRLFPLFPFSSLLKRVDCLLNGVYFLFKFSKLQKLLERYFPRYTLYRGFDYFKKIIIFSSRNSPFCRSPFCPSNNFFSYCRPFTTTKFCYKNRTTTTTIYFTFLNI